MDTNLIKLWKAAKDRKAWSATIHGVAKSGHELVTEQQGIAKVKLEGYVENINDDHTSKLQFSTKHTVYACFRYFLTPIPAHNFCCMFITYPTLEVAVDSLRHQK